MSVHSDPHRRIRRQGPATLRGKAIPKTTTDERLLDRRGPSDWVHTDPWRVLRIQAEFVEGFGLLAELAAAVSVFGSARTGRGTPEYEPAEQIGARLAAAGYAVITGGGPGIMEAANKGAVGAGGVSVGPRHRAAHRAGLNDYVESASIPVLLRAEDRVRQVLAGIRGAAGRLRHAGRALRGAHPGADGKITRFPIVLVGSDYWSGLLSWINGTLLDRGKVSAADPRLVQVADDPAEVVQIILDAHKSGGLRRPGRSG